MLKSLQSPLEQPQERPNLNMTKLLLQSGLLNMQIELWVLHLTPGFLPLNLNKKIRMFKLSLFLKAVFSPKTEHKYQVPTFGTYALC